MEPHTIRSVQEFDSLVAQVRRQIEENTHAAAWSREGDTLTISVSHRTVEVASAGDSASPVGPIESYQAPKKGKRTT